MDNTSELAELRKVAKRLGFSLKADKKVKVSFMLQAENYNKLKEIAEREHKSMNKVINSMIYNA